MNRTAQQTRLLIFLLCAGGALSLAQGRHLRDSASHDPKGTLACSKAGHPEKIPALERQQVDCSSSRPTFQGSVAFACSGAITATSEQAQPLVSDKSYRPLSFHDAV